jgi:hypothetical protein
MRYENDAVAARDGRANRAVGPIGPLLALAVMLAGPGAVAAQTHPDGGHERPAEVPMEYASTGVQPRDEGGVCGVIVLWTKGR